MSKKQQKKYMVGGGLFLLFYMGTGITNSLEGGIWFTILVCTAAGFIFWYRKYRRFYNLKVSDIEQVDQMNGRDFELYLGDLFRFHGYSVQVTQASGDFGADLILKKDGSKIVVQAKRYTKNVGIKAVQEIASAKDYYHAHLAWVVSNQGYIKAARDLANRTSVHLIDREALISMMVTAKTLASSVQS